ncbi:helix-turn-helix transcriptional regulator [Phormidium tenue FACHB-886]|nr:helix-turn-helix transcriptional regulator [Phormidium tenue FACHB-886]
MLIDSQGRKILPNRDRGALHYHLLIDQQGTGLHHAAHLPPDNFGEHEHKAHQITVPFGETFALSTWHSDAGNHKQNTVKAGQCYVVPSEQPHGLILNRPSELVNFYLTPSFITEALPESAQGGSLELGNLHISEDPFIRQLAAAVRTDRLLHGVANKLLVESATNVLAFHLVNQYATADIKLKHPGQLSAFHLARVREFIEAESTNNITIANIARVTGYSAVHFSRMFKQATGQSPYQYLTNYRITRAKTLLQTTELSIAEVAYQVGFGSHAHFSTQFRRVTGVSPQAYRTQVSNNCQ